MRARWAGLVVSLAQALFGVSAWAQGGANAAAAQALYDTATQEMDQKDYASACPRLEDVVKLIPDGVGARVTLGQCYEGLGKLASAWSAYAGAETTALRIGQKDRAARAHETVEALRPRLATLTLQVSADLKDLASLSIRRDGAEVGRATWGVALPVDRGRHTILASSTGKATWSRTIDVASDGSGVVVTIEPLVDAAGPSLPPPPAEATPKGSPAMAIVGLVAAGAGVVVGTVTGALTLAKDCKANTCTSSELSSAKTTAWISDIGFGVGVAGAALGVVGLVMARRPSAPSAYLQITPNRLTVGGTF